MLNTIFVLAGLVLVMMTLNDVFETVVVPGGNKASLRVARRVVTISLPVWKAVAGRRRPISKMFAPAVLVASFVAWMALLTTGFGLMAYATRHHFRPQLSGFADAVYVVATALTTVGAGVTTAIGPARWVIVLAGFCGLAVMTMAVTYLLEVQSSISKRDIGILKLNTTAGDPPSAVALLERLTDLRSLGDLKAMMKEGRDWCATVRQSHSSHPSLIYFRSAGTGAGWPAALGALLDLALICERWIDDDELYGPALLLRDDGSKMARELSTLIRLEPVPGDASTQRVEMAASRLEKLGLPIRAGLDFNEEAKARALLQDCVNALADHLGNPAAQLLPGTDPLAMATG
jgi:hypothetical protein